MNKIDIDKLYSNAEKNYELKEFKKAFESYLILAEAGFSDAQVIVGKMYFSGSGVSENFDLFLNWYEKAANNGSSHAQVYLSRKYFHEKVFDKSIELCELAVENNYSSAIRLKGTLLENGCYGEENKSKALQFFKKSSEMGNILAMKSYARLLWKEKKILFGLLWYLKYIFNIRKFMKEYKKIYSGDDDSFFNSFNGELLYGTNSIDNKLGH